MGYTYRRRRSGPNWGLIVSVVLVVGAAAYFVPQYLNPQAGPPPPPLGGDAAPVAAAAPSPVATPPAARLAEARSAHGQPDTGRAAAAIYADVARAEPTLAAAHAGWARALVYANKPAEAIEHAQKAADLEPRSAAYQAVLALAFDWSGNVDRALTSARRATELDPKLPDGWAYLAEAETDKFRLREASDALDRATAAGGADNPEVLRVQAYLAETNADYTSAADLYKRAVEKAPAALVPAPEPGARATRAQAVRRRDPGLSAGGRPEPGGRARRRWHGQRLLRHGGVRLGPVAPGACAGDRPELRHRLGTARLGLLRAEGVRQGQPDFEKAVDLEKDPARNATYRHALGWIYLNTKQNDKAKAEFTTALEENPDLEGAKEGLQVLASTPPSSTLAGEAPPLCDGAPAVGGVAQAGGGGVFARGGRAPVGGAGAGGGSWRPRAGDDDSWWTRTWSARGCR